METVAQDPAHLVRHGHFVSAIALLNGAIRDNPRDAGAWTLLGVCYVETGCLQEAVAAFTRALLIEDGMPETCEALGCAWLRRGDSHAARDWFHQALSLSTNTEQRASVLENLAGALKHEGRYEAAQFVLDEARDTCVDDAEWERATCPFACRFLDRCRAFSSPDRDAE